MREIIQKEDTPLAVGIILIAVVAILWCYVLLVRKTPIPTNHNHVIDQVDVVERERTLKPDTLIIQVGDETYIIITEFEEFIDVTPPTFIETEIND